MRVLGGEVGSGDTRRPVWVWAWDLGTRAVLSPLHPSLCDLERVYLPLWALASPHAQ